MELNLGRIIFIALVAILCTLAPNQYHIIIVTYLVTDDGYGPKKLLQRGSPIVKNNGQPDPQGNDNLLDVLPRQYVIVFEDSVYDGKDEDAIDKENAELLGFKHRFKFSGITGGKHKKKKGSGHSRTVILGADDDETLRKLKDHERIRHIFPDAVLQLSQYESLSTTQPCNSGNMGNSWGRYRISKPNLPLPSAVLSSKQAGNGVIIYSIDSGIGRNPCLKM